MVSAPSISEVEAGYKGLPVENGELSPSDATELINEAVAMYDAVFDDQILFTSETEDASNAVKYLARHKWALRLGQTASESQAAASITYNLPSGAPRSLMNTTYGQEFSEYLQSEPNIAVFRTR